MYLERRDTWTSQIKHAHQRILYNAHFMSLVRHQVTMQYSQQHFYFQFLLNCTTL
jgi:hypothetical protein